MAGKDILKNALNLHVDRTLFCEKICNLIVNNTKIENSYVLQLIKNIKLLVIESQEIRDEILMEE